MLCLEVPTGGNHCFASGQASYSRNDLPALFKDGGASGAVDRTVYATATHEAGVGSIDDSIGALLGDVTL
jgi:hypothetical protein